MMDNQIYLTAFSDYLQFERGLSPHTQKNYLRDLNQLNSLIEQTQEANLSFMDIKDFHIRLCIATLNSKGLSAQSIARSVSAWRHFFSWLCQYHGLTLNPVHGIKAPKRSKPLPKTLTTDQAVNIVTIEGDDFFSVRDRAIMELLYSSGLRLSELINITLDKLDLHDGTVEVIGKGEKTRVVPVGQQAIKAILVWFNHRATLKLTRDDPAYLFLTKKGTRLSARAVQSRLKVWAQKKGLDTNLYPHLLRHSFASHVLQSSGDLRAVQEMLGHANISTTQVYTHLDFQHLAKSYDAAHPRAKKPTDSSK